MPICSNYKISSFPNANDANIFAFIEFIERYQEKDLDAWIMQVSMLRSKAMRKKKKIKKNVQRKISPAASKREEAV